MIGTRCATRLRLAARRLPLVVCLIVASVVLFGSFASAQEPEFEGIPVHLQRKELFRIRHDFGQFSAEERAKAAEEKLFDLAFNPFRPGGTFGLRDLTGRTDLLFGDQIISTVTDEDAQTEGVPRRQLAEQRLEVISRAVELERTTLWQPQRFALGILYTIAFTIALVLLTRFVTRRLARYIAALESGERLAGRLAVLTPAERLSQLNVRRLVARGLRVVRLVVLLAAIGFFVPVAMSFFPRTSFITDALVDNLLNVLSTVWTGLVGYFPKLLFVIVIAIITYYTIRVTKLLLDEVKRGSIELPGFDPDWAEPTYKIVAFLQFALAIVVAFPYLPGSQSEAFKGVSLLLGLLLSLASSSAISNIIAGVILTYTGAFRLGDRVKIADTVGDVIAKSLLVTRVRTVKKVDIAVPNSLVLGSHIINFSREAKTTGVILNTTVTIGYDAPWRTVHELLIAAALESAEILSDPGPFVLQTGLDDFYVRYELNAYTRNPWQMAAIYSQLHQNIQDKFNEAGIEIMSPHYSSLRDGNRVAIPDSYVPETYKTPAFRFLPSTPKAKGSSGGGRP